MLFVCLNAIAVLGSLVLAWKKGDIALERVLPLLLFVVILTPTTRLPGSDFGVRVELGMIAVLFSLFVLRGISSQQKVSFLTNPALKWFVIFGISMMLSVCFATVVQGIPMVARDVMEFVKLFEYFALFLLVVNIPLTNRQLGRLYVFALVGLICSAFVSFAQYFNLFHFNQYVSPVYLPTQMTGLINNLRVTGTTENPNVFGALMAMSSCLALSAVLYITHRSTRLLALFGLVIFPLALLLTQSRSALIAMGVGVILILVYFYPSVIGLRAYMPKLMMIIPTIAVIALFIVSHTPRRSENRYAELEDPAGVETFQLRLTMWEANLKLWRQSPIVGWGPAKARMETVVDNEWLLLARRYGVLGLVVFICWFVSVSKVLAKNRAERASPEITAFTIALQATIPAYAVYMGAAAVYHALQLMPLFLLLVGIACAPVKREIHRQVVGARPRCLGNLQYSR